MLLPIQRVHLSRKTKQKKNWASRKKLKASGAKLKASASHIWPAGCMLCIPGLNKRGLRWKKTESITVDS